MKIAIKLALLTALALIGVGSIAGAASAVEVTYEAPNEETGEVEHCPAVIVPSHGAGSGGCIVRATSNGAVELGSPLGMILCNHVFEARIDESGAGFIYSKALSNCTPATRVPCAEPGSQDPWPVRLTSNTNLEVSYCVVVGGAVTSNCHLRNVQVTQVSHQQVNFTTNGHQACEQPGISVDGTWTATSDASHPDIEIAP